MSVVLLAVGIALLVAPGMSLRPSRRLGPQRYVTAVALSVTAGAVFLEAALALAAVPTVLRAFGLTQLASLCERVAGHLVSGGAAAGWVATLGGLALPALMIIGVRKGSNDRRVLWRYAHVLGQSVGRVGRCELVVLDIPSALALALPGEPARIVVSTGLMQGLEDHELRAVVKHERAHIELGHHRHHVAVSGLTKCLAWLPAVRRSLRAWRFGLERAADEHAAAPCQRDRVAVRDALHKLATAPQPAEWVALAFSSSTLTAERIRMLDQPPETSRLLAASVWVGLGLGIALAAAALLAWIGHTHHLAVVAPFCHL